MKVLHYGYQKEGANKDIKRSISRIIGKKYLENSNHICSGFGI